MDDDYSIDISGLFIKTLLIRVELNENGSKGQLGATRSLKHHVTLGTHFRGVTNLLSEPKVLRYPRESDKPR